MEREATRSTAIGGGVAIPHAKSDIAPRVMLACGVAPMGVDFDSPDEAPVRVAFLVVSPNTGASHHVQALSWVSRAVAGEGVVDRLVDARSPRAVLKLLHREAEGK